MDSDPKEINTRSELPDTSRSEFLDAFQTFDDEYRGEGRWVDWQSSGDHKYAIEHDGQLYPVKQIVSLATGRPPRSFSVGQQANSFVQERGFDVANLHRSSLQEILEEILDIYPEARDSKSYGKTGTDGETRRIWTLFEQAKELLEESSVVSQRPHLQVDWSVGRGKWARAPWMALLDERETSTVRKGFFPSIGFDEDMSRVVLGIGVGVDHTVGQYGKKTAEAILRNRKERLRRRLGELEDEGFLIGQPVQIRRRNTPDQASSGIAEKVYERGSLPVEEELLADLETLVHAYDQQISRRQKGPSIHIDRSRLQEATDNIIRPAVLRRGDLEEGGREGYHHHEVIPAATPQLTPERLEEAPREAVLSALRADVNLLSGNWQRSPAQKFFQRAEPVTIHEEMAYLLYGAAPLGERVRRFLDWGEKQEVEDGKTAGVDGTVAGYFLALSDPEEYAFCKTQLVYRPAVKALLGEDEVRSDWTERLAHTRVFYQAALKIFQEEHEDLPFFDVMHVHIAFYLAENEDDEAPWGRGIIATDRENREDESTDTRTVLKILPGHKAQYWEDCRENGYIRLGWSDVGDLRQYDSEDELREAFHEAYYPNKHSSEAKVSAKTSEVWAFAQLQPGDFVVANRGMNEVLAVGTVVEPGYELRTDLDEHQHTVHVEWDESYAQEIPPQERWRSVMVCDVGDDLLEHVLKRRGTTTIDGGSDRQSYQPPPLEKIYEWVTGQGMVIDRRTLRRYHVSLRTRGFVILSGVSGTGKTWLTKLYADAVRAKRLLVPVAPNWTTNEDLTGYYNPVDDEYHHTQVSRFLKRAEEAYEAAQKDDRRPQPYHLVLDEMNLARVEYYFAQFLSKMEEQQREKTVHLSLGPDDRVRLPANLSFIGTVNVDETTHAFADKVYDRAQLIELEAPRAHLEDRLEGEPHADTLLEVWDAIGDVAPFAFRVVDEISQYIDMATDHGSSWEEALDEQLLQKILPKVKGTEPAVGDALRAFLEVADEGTYPLSHKKAKEMLKTFRSHGFTSYF